MVTTLVFLSILGWWRPIWSWQAKGREQRRLFRCDRRQCTNSRVNYWIDASNSGPRSGLHCKGNKTRRPNLWSHSLIFYLFRSPVVAGAPFRWYLGSLSFTEWSVGCRFQQLLQHIQWFGVDFFTGVAEFEWRSAFRKSSFPFISIFSVRPLATVPSYFFRALGINFSSIECW